MKTSCLPVAVHFLVELPGCCLKEMSCLYAYPQERLHSEAHVCTTSGRSNRHFRADCKGRWLAVSERMWAVPPGKKSPEGTAVAAKIVSVWAEVCVRGWGRASRVSATGREG